MPSVTECLQSTAEWRTNDRVGSDLEGSSHGLVAVLFRQLSGGSEENYKNLTFVAGVSMIFEPGTSRKMQGYGSGSWKSGTFLIIWEFPILLRHNLDIRFSCVKKIEDSCRLCAALKMPIHVRVRLASPPRGAWLGSQARINFTTHAWVDSRESTRQSRQLSSVFLT